MRQPERQEKGTGGNSLGRARKRTAMHSSAVAGLWSNSQPLVTLEVAFRGNEREEMIDA